MRIPTRSTLSLALAGALVAACSGAAAPQAPAADLAAAASAIPAAATPAPTSTEITPPPASSTATPMPTTDGQGDEVVRGLEVLAGLMQNYTATKVGDVVQYRGGVVSLTDHMNDARVDGTVTFTFSLDLYGVAASEWGEMKVENKGGSWDGPCTGGAWSEGDGIVWSCWLIGSGAYDGHTYFKQTSKEPVDEYAKVVGVVYPGEPPNLEP